MVILRPYQAGEVELAQQEFSGLQAGELQWFGFSSIAQLQTSFATDGLLTPDHGRLIDKDEGQRVGGVQWFKRHWGPAAMSSCWKIGISLREDVQGRGIGTQAQGADA